MANPGVVVTLATLNCICTLAERQDILKGLGQTHDLELLCLVKFPGISSYLLLLCLLCLTVRVTRKFFLVPILNPSYADLSGFPSKPGWKDEGRSRMNPSNSQLIPESSE